MTLELDTHDSELRLDASRWIRRGPPGLGLWDPQGLTDHDLRALWRFRLRYVDLKPDVDPERDFASFSAFLRRASDVWIWLERGTILGVGAHRHERLEFAGQPRFITHTDYGFIARRGRARSMLSQAWVYSRMIVAHPTSPTYFVGFSYPHSYLVYAETLSTLWLVGDPELPAEERAFAEHLAAHLGGHSWDPARRLYRFPTLPRERQVSTSAPMRRERLARYESLNPDWRAGQGLCMIARVSPRSMLEASASMLSRAMHTRSRS